MAGIYHHILFMDYKILDDSYYWFNISSSNLTTFKLTLGIRLILWTESFKVLLLCLKVIVVVFYIKLLYNIVFKAL